MYDMGVFLDGNKDTDDSNSSSIYIDKDCVTYKKTTPISCLISRTRKNAASIKAMLRDKRVFTFIVDVQAQSGDKVDVIYGSEDWVNLLLFNTFI